MPYLLSGRFVADPINVACPGSRNYFMLIGLGWGNQCVDLGSAGAVLRPPRADPCQAPRGTSQRQ